MKKLMFTATVVISVALNVFGEEPVKKAEPSTSPEKVVDKAAETWSKRFKMTPESWLAIPESERNAKVKAYYAEQKKKELEVWPKRCNLTVEEWTKLSAAEKRKRVDEFYAAQKKKAASATK